ncbi:hypothetical protein BH09BAC1_BH09BAC1_03580 [soil metagenome]
MKNFHFLMLFVAFFAAASLSSCEKDEGTLPAISFKTGAGYTAADVTVAAGDTFKVGINAAKTEDKDVLKTFNISRKYDAGTDATVYNVALTSAQGDNYSYDYDIITRTTAGTEKYTFTITNRDGLVNQVSLTVTVQ